MSDEITFEAEEQAIEFVNQFPYYDFARKGRIVTGIFFNSYLRYANLSNANLEGGNFEGSWFVGANLTGANLTGTNLAWASFREANLRCAYLVDANLSKSILLSANLSHANLEGANLRKVDGKDADLATTIMKNADLSDSIFHRATFEGAKLDGANLTGVDFSHSRVSGTTILSVPAMGSSRDDHLYATPIYDDNGNQIGWGYHAGCFYGTYEELREAIVRKHGKGEYLDCLNILLIECIRKFNPQQQEQQS